MSRTVGRQWACTTTLVVTFLLLLMTSATFRTSAEGSTEAVEVRVLDAKPVLQWSPRDVELWMNTTIGYPEYSGYIRKHLVDGPTLLEMEPADFESFLPIENPLHVIKIQAHMKMLRGLCSCRSADGEDGEGDDGPKELWGYMKAHPTRVWIEGVTAMFFPRVAMAGVYFFDKDMYLAMVGRGRSQAEMLATAADADVGTTEVSVRVVDKAKAALYWLFFLVAPDLYFAYRAACLIPGNYLMMPFLALHFLFQALNEYMLVYMQYKGTAFEPGTSWISRIGILFSYTMAFPFAATLVGSVFPTFLQYLVVAGLVLHSAVTMFGFVILVTSGAMAAAGETGQSETAAAGESGEQQAAAASSAAHTGKEEKVD